MGRMLCYICIHFRGDVEELLLRHRQRILSIGDDDDRRVTVRRKHLLEDTLKTLKRVPWDPSKHLKVVFIGEPGIDDGGPRREYFRLLLDEIAQNNSYFHGLAHRRVPLHNVISLQNNIFFYFGQIIALSVIHDGPFLQCLAPTVVYYILQCDAEAQGKIRAVSIESD